MILIQETFMRKREGSCSKQVETDLRLVAAVTTKSNLEKKKTSLTTFHMEQQQIQQEYYNQ